MWITWLVMLRQTPETSIGTLIVRKKTPKVVHPWKGRMERVLLSRTSKTWNAEEFNGQFTDVFNKNERTQVPLLDRSVPFMNDIVISKDGVIKLLKGLNPSKALGPDELHPRVLKELATRVRSGICSSFLSSNQWTQVKSRRNGLLQISAPFSRRVTGHLRAIIARFPELVYLASYSNT